MNKTVDIDALIQKKAEILRQQSIKKKRLLVQDLENIEAERKAKIYKLEEMNRQINTLKITKNSNFSRNSTYTNQDLYLENIKKLQAKAKELLDSEPYSFKMHEKKLLNEDTLKSVKNVNIPLKIPVLVPQNMIEKSKKIQPPCIQRALKSGEIVNVYLTSESPPLYSPMVNAEMTLNREELKKVEDLQAEIKIKEEKRWKSISPHRKRYEDLDLTKPESVNLRVATPMTKFERHNFRDYSHSELSQTPTRNWVGQRMKVYSDIIKTSVKPKISEKKQIEIMIRNERLKNKKIAKVDRVKIINNY